MCTFAMHLICQSHSLAGYVRGKYYSLTSLMRSELYTVYAECKHELGGCYLTITTNLPTDVAQLMPLLLW